MFHLGLILRAEDQWDDIANVGYQIRMLTRLAGVAEYFNYDGKHFTTELGFVLLLIYPGIGVGGIQVFGNNFMRLLDLKKRCDPSNIFSKGPQLLSQTPPE